MRIKILSFIIFLYSITLNAQLETTQTPNIEKINNTDEITFHITAEKNIIKKGKIINILCNIINNGNQSVKFDSRIYFHIEDLSRNIMLPVRRSNTIIINLKEGQNRLSIINPFTTINYKDEFNHPMASYPWPYIKEGRYRIYFSIETEKGKVKSNEIEIEVLQLNEEDQLLFQQLIAQVETHKTKDESYNLLRQNIDSFYAAEYYYLYGSLDTDVLSKEGHYQREEVINLIKEHIIKFPNSSKSARLYGYLERDFDDCQQAIEEIVETLKAESPECWLLQIIEYTKELIKEREQ